jgi:hypothetical protein
MRVWTGFIWIMTGPVAASCERGNEPSLSIKRWKNCLAERLLAIQEILCSIDLDRLLKAKYCQHKKENTACNKYMDPHFQIQVL